MKKLFLATVLLALQFTPLLSQAQAISTLHITEVMPNPRGLDTDFEWIEFSNYADTEIALESWQLNGQTLPVALLQPFEIIVLARNPGAVRTEFDVHNRVFQHNFSLNNSGATMTLVSSSSNHTFSYTASSEGISFELLRGDCQTVQLHPDGHSLGQSNHDCGFVPTTPTPSPTELPQGEYSQKVIIQALMPYPEQGNEWLELSNLDSIDVSIANWILEDASANQYLIPTGNIPSGGSFKIFPLDVTLNNNGDTIVLKNPDGYQVDIFHYTSSKKGQALLTSNLSSESSTANSCAIPATAKEITTSPVTTVIPTAHLTVPIFYRAD